MAIARGLLTAGAPGGVCALCAGVVLALQHTGLEEELLALQVFL